MVILIILGCSCAIVNSVVGFILQSTTAICNGNTSGSVGTNDGGSNSFIPGVSNASSDLLLCVPTKLSHEIYCDTSGVLHDLPFRFVFFVALPILIFPGVPILSAFFCNCRCNTTCIDINIVTAVLRFILNVLGSISLSCVMNNRVFILYLLMEATIYVTVITSQCLIPQKKIERQRDSLSWEEDSITDPLI